MNILRYLILVCVIFLQSGYSYYVSFQVLALLLLILVVFWHGYNFKISMLGIFSIFLFISFIVYTAIFSPLVINTKSTNIFLTVAALLVYSLMIFGLSLLYIKRYINSLFFMRQLASSLILALFIVMIFSELNFIPFLNREILTMQNIGLIDNFTSIEDIELNILFDQWIPKVDLFYGEPSFLAIVIFASLGSFEIANKSVENFGGQSFIKKGVRFANLYNLTPILGIAMLVYIQSFAAIICAVVVAFYSFLPKIISKKTSHINWVFYTILIIFVVAFSWDYFIYRISMVQSYSFEQRFGLIFEMSPTDWIFGLKDDSMLPVVGIHNGVIYLIAISGVGGIAYFLYLLRHVYLSTTTIGLSVYAVLLILAIFMQNGGIFSPNKIVLISLVLLPVAAVRSAEKDVIREIRSGAVS